MGDRRPLGPASSRGSMAAGSSLVRWVERARVRVPTRSRAHLAPEDASLRSVRPWRCSLRACVRSVGLHRTRRDRCAISIAWNYIRNADNVVAAATSADGGATWNDPVIVHSGPSANGLAGDKESITADPVRPGVAYATWEVFKYLPARNRDDEHRVVRRSDTPARERARSPRRSVCFDDRCWSHLGATPGDLQAGSREHHVVRSDRCRSHDRCAVRLLQPHQARPRLAGSDALDRRWSDVVRPGRGSRAISGSGSATRHGRAIARRGRGPGRCRRPPEW